MIPLAITSVFGLMAILYKFLSLTSNRVIPGGLTHSMERFEKVVESGGEASVISELEAGRSTLARLGHISLRMRGETQGDTFLALEAASRKEAARLHAGIIVLDVVITVAPLLGLLGTASGLVKIFQAIGGNYDAALLAKGIATALNTTIFGLAIAVPCVIAHGFFSRRIEVMSARLESLLAEFAITCRRLDEPN